MSAVGGMGGVGGVRVAAPRSWAFRRRLSGGG